MAALLIFIALSVGLTAGAFFVYRNLAPQLEQLKQQLQQQRTATQDAEAKWLELVSLLDDQGQLPEGAADKLLQRPEASAPELPSGLSKRPGKSADRRIAEIARIKNGLPSLDSLEGMRSEDLRLVLIARIKAKRPMLHSLEGLKSEDRRLVEVACAKAGVVL